MGKLKQELEETVTNELQMFYRMSGVMVQMLMFEAEQQKTVLKGIDVNYMENYKALENMKEFENINKMQGSSFNLNPKKGNSMLPALGNALTAKF